MNWLYLDCFSGVSGDMFIGSLLDLGVPIEYLKDALSNLDISVDISCDKQVVKGIASTKFIVENKVNPPLRHLPEIEDIINNSSLDGEIKDKSLGVFSKLADAEASVHGISRDKIHFHEIGAVDTIVDIVGSFLCLEYLKIGKVYSSTIPWPRGFATMDHGTYPLPAPATALLLTGIPCIGTDIEMELVTPTGAALISALVESFGVLPLSIPKAIGYGAGSKVRTDSVPNLLRSILLEPRENIAHHNDTVAVIETEVDDLNPELFTYLYEQLFTDEFVLDVFTTPIFMKKNRPGFLISVISKPEGAASIMKTLMTETTSLGVRYRLQQRICLIREEEVIETPWGAVRIKIAKLPTGAKRYKPEFEDCRKIAVDSGSSLVEVYMKINAFLTDSLKLD